MKRFFGFLIFGLLFQLNCFAHFGMVIPSDGIVEQQDDRTIILDIMFAHPFEGNSMNMVKPEEFGVYFAGLKKSLLDSIKPLKVKGYSDSGSYQGWQASLTLKRPGDYIFYVVPKPYWEPAEDCFIVHYTKVIVNGFGAEVGWDEPLGLKTEIIPLTRPYGLYVGNVFQGKVLVNGKSAPFTEVEVEYYNRKGRCQAPAAPFVTQVVKCDENGVFTYAMPKAGWWGFAALNEDENTIKYEEEEKPIEIGAVIWVEVCDMK